MARLVKRCPITWPPEGAEEPGTNPSVTQHDKQPDATEGEVIVEYDPDVDAEGSEPKNEPVAQAEEEKNSDAEYAKMEIY